MTAQYKPMIKILFAMATLCGASAWAIDEGSASGQGSGGMPAGAAAMDNPGSVNSRVKNAKREAMSPPKKSSPSPRTMDDPTNDTGKAKTDKK